MLISILSMQKNSKTRNYPAKMLIIYYVVEKP